MSKETLRTFTDDQLAGMQAARNFHDYLTVLLENPSGDLATADLGNEPKEGERYASNVTADMGFVYRYGRLPLANGQWISTHASLCVEGAPLETISDQTIWPHFEKPEDTAYHGLQVAYGGLIVVRTKDWPRQENYTLLTITAPGTPAHGLSLVAGKIIDYHNDIDATVSPAITDPMRPPQEFMQPTSAYPDTTIDMNILSAPDVRKLHQTVRFMMEPN